MGAVRGRHRSRLDHRTGSARADDVRSRRGTKREAAEAKIIMVGGRLELFAQALRVRGFDSSQERGLPVLINIPQNLKLYPGELVDLALKN